MHAQSLDGVEPDDNRVFWKDRIIDDPIETPVWHVEAEEEVPQRRVSGLAVLLVLAAIGWAATSAWAIIRSGPLTLEGAPYAVALVSGPLILLGILWLIFGQTMRRETDRFRTAVAEMRHESQSLEAVLAVVAQRLEENRSRLSEDGETLMKLGEEAADRLGRVTHYLARETATLDAKSEALEAAAANAKVDIGVLLHDLPRAAEQADAVAESMQRAGLEAHGRAGALEGQLSALLARAREADEAAGGAAQRLGAQLARIESNAAAAGDRIEQASLGMSAAVDEAMARAADATEQSRSALDAQAAATLAAIEQSRAALAHAGDDAARNLTQRLDGISRAVEGLASHLAAQDATSGALMARLTGEIEELEGRFARLTESGTAGAGLLNDSFETVRDCAQKLFEELRGGHDQAGALIGRAQEMARALAGVGDRLEGPLPEALARVESQAERTGAAADAIAPRVEAIVAASQQASDALAGTETAVTRQQQAVDALVARLTEGLGAVEGHLAAVGQAAADADKVAARVTGETAPELVDAMLRVRDAAALAAERAREAIAGVIPSSAAALAEASGDALAAALNGPVQAQVRDMNAATEQALDTARKASERLTRQLVTIGETAAAVEARFEETQRVREDQDAQHLSRRVALLIESLHSTAIDVTKILSNEVEDAAWGAYLKGDRGVFTRRAVKLLDSREAREIGAHYETDSDFREQVNRYIADFEALLRRVMGDRDGSALSMTILSSDMGKLYVALAQAIERLR